MHCDPTAAAYIKTLLDAIFGAKNFRNEIVWQRTAVAKSSTKRLPRSADIILHYSNTNDYVWNQPHVVVDADDLPENIKRVYNKVDEWGHFRYTNMSGPHINVNDRPWKGYTPMSTGRSWSVPLKGEYATYIEEKLIPGYKSLPDMYARLDALDAAGQLSWSKTGTLRLKKYLTPNQKLLITTIWTDIHGLSASHPEITGYPTQKPVALYERIIKASSNEGDVVLDPFCGMSTTLVAAERLNRQWIGCDIWQGALDVVMNRMRQEGLMVPELMPNEESSTEVRLTEGKVIYLQYPPVRTDAGEISTPFLKTVLKAPKLKWEKLSHTHIQDYLAVAQSLTGIGSAGDITCAGCGRILEVEFMELDHVMPRSDGGANDITNRILLCRPCNGKKSNSLTLSGLVKANKKSGWMRDLEKAQWATQSARAKAESIKISVGV